MRNIERQHYAEQLAAQRRLRYATTHKRVRLRTDRQPVVSKKAAERYHALAQEYLRLLGAGTPGEQYFQAALMKKLLLREWGYYVDNHHRAHIVAAVERIRSGCDDEVSDV